MELTYEKIKVADQELPELKWEVFATEFGGQHTEIIHCKNKREALKLEKEYKKNPKYEMVYIQANDGTQLIDDL